MTRRGEWLAGGLLAGVGALFALALLELAVRALHLVPDRFWEPDPDRGVRLAANRSGWWTQEDREFVVPIQINSQGLRDVEHAWDKPEGTKRVLVLGDSFVEALHVGLEDLVGRRLENLLNQEGHGPYEVISAGVSGYGTAAETLFFEKELRRYRPDVVVLSFYPGNDVKNNSPTLEDYLQPQYDDGGALVRVVNRQKVPRAPRIKSWQFVRQTVQRRQPRLAETLVGLGLLGASKQAPERNGIPVDFGVYASAEDAEWTDAWERTQRLLFRLRHAVETNGARFVVLIVSTRDQIYPQSWREIVDAHPAMRGVDWDLDAPQRRVERWCAEAGVSCLSLASTFRDRARAAEEPLHFPRDGHWTPAGHALAAEALARFLALAGL